MPEGLGGCLKTGYTPSLTGKHFLAGFPIPCVPGLEQTGLTGSEITCWGTLNPQQSEKPVFSMLLRSGSEESATQSFDLAVPAARGNHGCLCTTYEEQVGILQKQSCWKPEVPDVNIIANVITFPLLWKYCLVIWLSWWQEEVRAEFLLGSLRGEGPKGKTCEGLCASNCL